MGQNVVIVDLHATALNTETQMLEAFVEVVQKLGLAHINSIEALLKYLASDAIKISKEKALVMGKKGPEGLFAKLLGVEKSDDAFILYDQVLEQKTLTALKSPASRQSIIAPGFIQAMNDLHASGVKLAMASNSSTKFLQGVTDAIFEGQENPFVEILLIGSDKAPKDKTGNAIASALSSVKGDLDHVIFVGDALGDLRCVDGYNAKPDCRAQVHFAPIQLQASSVKLSDDSLMAISTSPAYFSPTPAKLYECNAFKDFDQFAEIYRTTCLLQHTAEKQSYAYKAAQTQQQTAHIVMFAAPNCNWRLFQQQIHHFLSEGHPVTVFQVTPYHTIQRLAEAALSIPGPLHLVGVSVGAHACLEVYNCAKKPADLERIQGMTLMSVKTEPASKGKQAKRQGYVDQLDPADQAAQKAKHNEIADHLCTTMFYADHPRKKELDKGYKVMATETGPDNFRACVQGMLSLGEDVLSSLRGKQATIKATNIPIHLITGAEDQRFKVSGDAKQVGTIVDGICKDLSALGIHIKTSTLIEASGHLPTIEQPEILTPLLAHCVSAQCGLAKL